MGKRACCHATCSDVNPSNDIPHHHHGSPTVGFAATTCELILNALRDCLPLTPDDSYILYNRGRAHLALGSTAEAKTDFTEAASTKYRQLKARKLAEEALVKLK